MKLSRRDMIFGGSAFAVGGALASVTGLSAYYIRRQLRGPYEGHPSNQVRALVSSDGWVLSDADRTELASSPDYSVDAIDVTKFDVQRDVDFVGGDVGAFRAAGPADCAKACEATEDCAQFTYARPDHEITTKRQMCWLKTAEVDETRTGERGYWSGVKK